MPIKIRDAFLIVMLWLAACAVAVVVAIDTIESVAGEFDYIATRVMTVSTMFLAAVGVAPHLKWKPVVVAFYTAVFVVALILLTHFWLVDFVRGLKQ